MGVDFSKAISIAREEMKTLIPKAKDISVEGVIIEGSHYEVTLSYLEKETTSKINTALASEKLGGVLAALAEKKKMKVFLVSKEGEFKGFRNIKSSEL